MKFVSTKLTGSYLIYPEKREDNRGFFARIFCVNEFEKRGIESKVVQTNISRTLKKGTMRGMHYQKSPHEETKLIRCTRGSVYDVIIDIRPNSPSYKQWFGTELSAENHTMLFVPRGFVHGFITLEDDCEMIYEVSEFYTPGSEGGIRYNDPVFGIKWPVEIADISAKDASYSDFKDKNDNS
jgi:dTDP-4-dehydrorhamnose 3,5-epimerase